MIRHNKNQRSNSGTKKKFYEGKIKYAFLVLIAIFLVVNIKDIYAYFSEYISLPNHITINAEYTVKFNSNTGVGSMADQRISYNVVGNLRQNTYTKPGFIFNGWNTDPNGSGTPYIDRQGVLNLGDIILYAQWINAGNVAEINGTYYNTLQSAVDAVPTDNTETTILLLQNTSELITVTTGQNIVFDFQNNTLINGGNTNVIINTGTIKFVNGTITSSGQVAVQNKARLTIGTSDGSVDITNPVLQGATYGVTNSGSLFNFYDGVIKGVTDAISGTVNNIESGYTRTNSTEFIDGTTYKTTFLQ